jgi:hypothetical protein
MTEKALYGTIAENRAAKSADNPSRATTTMMSEGKAKGQGD